MKRAGRITQKGAWPFQGLKETEGWDLVIPSCLTNGDIGYFPMMDAYIEGGYEAGSSPFKAGTAEQIIAEGRILMKQMKA